MSNSIEHARRFRRRAYEDKIISTVMDETTGEPVVVQPKRGVGCKLAPETYRKIVLDMRAGISMYKVAADHEVGRSTVELIRHRHPDIIPSRSKQAVDRLHEVAEATSDLLLELTTKKKLPPGIVPVAFGIAADKLSAAMGTNVQRHHVVHAVLPQDDVKTALSSLKAGQEPAIDVETSHKNRDEIHDAQKTLKKGGGGGHESSGAGK